jgi:O-succinylbenzoate synthase
MPDGSPSIHRIVARLVNLPLLDRFATARSRLGERDVVLITVESSGLAGWGEVAPVPGHTEEGIDDLWERVCGHFDSHGLRTPQHATGMLAAAFAAAIADLTARSSGAPLWQVIGGGGNVPASAAIGVDEWGNPDRQLLDDAAGSGYRFAKLKITPTTDVSRLALLVGEYPRVRFGVDANGSLDVADRSRLEALDNLGLEYIEQPGPPDDLELHRQLCERLVTPISLDESASSIETVERIIDRRAADIINLKNGRFGPDTTLDLAARANSAGVRARLGGLIETGVGRAHSVALASHPCFSVVGDIAGSDRYFADDLVRPQWTVGDGQMALPDGPGIGVDVDEEAVAAHTIATSSVG